MAERKPPKRKFLPKTDSLGPLRTALRKRTKDELIALYWDVGRRIVERQEREGWGKSVVDRLAGDLQKAFPGMRDFSAVNVLRMRAFFPAYRDVAPRLPHPRGLMGQPDPSQAVTQSVAPISSQVVTEINTALPPNSVAGIPWGHNQVLLFKLKDTDERLWYAAKDSCQ